MKTLAILTAFATLTIGEPAAPLRADAPPPGTDPTHRAPRPPVRFLGDGAVGVVGFADEGSVNQVCLDGEKPKPDTVILACVFRREDGTAVMILPNPCRYEGYYAELACHEMGHVNGWGPEHGT